MKINKLWILIMLFLLIPFSYGYGCDGYHCLVVPYSLFYEDVYVQRDPNHLDYGVVYYTLDLNANVVQTIYQLEHNISIINMTRNVTSFFYPYYQWFPNEHIVFDTDGIYFDIPPVDEDIEFELTSFTGLPFYIDSCYIDCNYTGNDLGKCTPDGNGYTESISYNQQIGGVSVFSDVVKYYGYDGGVNVYSELDFNNDLRPGMNLSYPSGVGTHGKNRASFAHKCNFPSNTIVNVSVRCVLAKNPQYRGFDIFTGLMTANVTSDDVFKYGTVAHGTTSSKSVGTCSNIMVNYSANVFRWTNLTAEEIMDVLDIPYGETCINVMDNDGNIIGQNCYPWAGSESGIVDTVNDEINSVIHTQGVINQLRSNANLVNAMGSNNAALFWLGLLDLISSIVLLIYYVFIISVISGLVFVKVPQLFRKILNTFQEFGKIRRY